MITQENLVTHELIGLETTIVRSNNEKFVGLEGKIIDETKSMIVLNTIKGIKKIPKENSMWRFFIGSKESLVSGNILTKRPEDRIGGRHG